MKKTNILNFVLGVILAGLGLVVGISDAYAYDRTLQPDATGLIRIDSGIFVDVGDILRIPPGATVEFGSFGSIFARGRLEIGMEDADSGSTSAHMDLAKGVRIRSSSDRAPISSSGATVLVFNALFSGPQFITSFNGSTLLISSSTFESSLSSPIISVYSNSDLNISESVIRDKNTSGSADMALGSALLQVFSQSNATMTKVWLESPNVETAIKAYNGSSISVDDSHIANCHTGITAFNSTHVQGMGNSISCSNKDFIAYNDSSVELSERIVRKCCPRIVFVPGLQGSRLYRKGFAGILENQLWEPNAPKDVEKLFLDANGKSILKGIYTKDIIEKTNIAGTFANAALGNWLSPSVYSGFVTYLKKLKEDRLIDGYSVFPYDWRFAPNESDILGLISEIEKQAALASNGQVIVVSHSYGGFLAKTALYALAADDKKDLIQAAIYAAVPETGAPQALFAGLHGDKQEILGGLVLDAATAIRLAANMPSAHFLTPSSHFNAAIDLSFINMKTKSKSRYPSISGTSTGGVDSSGDPYSLPKVYAWIKQSVSNADKDVGQRKASPILLSLPSAPSAIVGLATGFDKGIRFEQSSFIESSIRSYSIVGIDMPTPIGMQYEYMPCLPFPSNIGIPIGSCPNKTTMKRIMQYSKRGDGVVIFDGKDRRSGKDIVLSLADYNAKSKAAISHANFMESKDVQHEIGTIVKETNVSPRPDDESDASGSGPASINPDNPWLNTDTVHVLSVSGFVDGRIDISIGNATATAATSMASGSSSIRIVTLDQRNGMQTISAAPEALAYTTVNQSDDGWSFASAMQYDAVSLRSLKDQSVSISFSEQTEIPSSADSGVNASAGADAISEIQIQETESFRDVPVGYGSVLTADMQYVTPIPGHLLSIDVDADGVGDMVISSKADVGDEHHGSGSGAPHPQATSSAPQRPQTYGEKKTIALDNLNSARISASRLEVFALMRLINSTISRSEQYIRNGNPGFAVMLIMKKEEWLAGISAQYADRMAVLETGLASRTRSGFRTEKERQKKLTEVAKIQAYVRDLARIKILFQGMRQKAVDLLD